MTATIAIACYLCGMYVFQALPIPETAAIRIGFSLGGSACAVLFLRNPFDFRKLLIPVLVLAIFWIAYICRFITDAFLDKIILQYLPNETYCLYITLCLAGLIGGLSIHAGTKFSLPLIWFALLISILVSLHQGEWKTGEWEAQGGGRLETTMMGPIGLGHLATSSILLSLFMTINGRFWALSALPPAGMLLVRAASRSPVVGLLAGVGVLSILVVRQKKLTPILALLIALVSSGFFIHKAARDDAFSALDRISLSSDNYLSPENSSYRDILLRVACEQFSLSPWTGYSLELQDCGQLYYPHNLIAESFSATGVIGGTAFTLIVALLVYASIRILFKCPDLGWASALFWQYLCLAMLSGAIATSYHFWILSGVVIGGAFKIKSANGE